MKQACKAIVLALLGLFASAQEPTVTKVAIPLITNDSHHRPISVNAESLLTTDQKIRVTNTSLLRGSDLPIELGILIDISNSEREAHLDDFVASAKQFADVIMRSQEDRVFFLWFNATPQVTGWLKKEQLQTIPSKIVPGGGTAVYDALFWACDKVMGPRDWRNPTRRILVLISDGEDNLSHISREYAVSAALQAGAVIFTVDTGSSGLEGKGERVLKYIAASTGGESFDRFRRKELPTIFANIQESVEGMYFLSYVPPDATKSAIHEIEVKPASKEKIELSYPRKYLWNP
jgi:Ca-activated chloride channel homolog